MPLQDKTKNIFVTVAGSTPQIITESLYDFIVQRKKRIDEIHIITTLHGERRCEEMIKAFPDGRFYRFCSEYGLNPMDMPITMHVITDENGNKLEDIRDARDNENAANFIDGVIQELCRREEVTVLASLSGGRKTMSAYMAYAMQMYGRRRDRLYHVLVAPPELEFNRDFYFPPADKRDVIVRTEQGEKSISTGDITITNAEIPFVRINDFLDFDSDLNIDLSYTDKVGLTQKSLDNIYKTELDFSDFKKGNVTVIWQNGVSWNVHFKPAEITLYKYIHEKGVMHHSRENQALHERELNKIYETIKHREKHQTIFTRQAIIDFRSKINNALQSKIKNKYILLYLEIGSLKNTRYPIYVFGKRE